MLELDPRSVDSQVIWPSRHSEAGEVAGLQFAVCLSAACLRSWLLRVDTSGGSAVLKLLFLPSLSSLSLHSQPRVAGSIAAGFLRQSPSELTFTARLAGQ